MTDRTWAAHSTLPTGCTWRQVVVAFLLASAVSVVGCCFCKYSLLTAGVLSAVGAFCSERLFGLLCGTKRAERPCESVGSGSVDFECSTTTRVFRNMLGTFGTCFPNVFSNVPRPLGTCSRVRVSFLSTRRHKRSEHLERFRTGTVPNGPKNLGNSAPTALSWGGGGVERPLSFRYAL